MQTTKKLTLLVTALALGGILSAGCGGPTDNATPPAGGAPVANNDTKPAAGASVSSSGSSFIQPFLSKAFDDYNKKTNFQINYTGGGSGKGIQDLTDGVTPFGASDAPMNDEELAKAKPKAGEVMNLPLIAGSIAIVYNVPGIDKGLKLDGATLADIFMAKIGKWNDPKIAALNPGVKLPDTNITLQVRADGSGSTYALSDYLSHVSPEWKTAMGTNKKLKWSDKALQQPKSDGVANNTKNTPGSISYVELSWATKSGLNYASIKNSAGKFVSPEPVGVTAAAASVKMPADFRVSIVDAPGADAYPISTFTFGLVPSDMTSQEHGKEIKEALKYVVSDAQQFAEGLGYAKLPDAVAKSVQDALDKVKTK